MSNYCSGANERAPTAAGLQRMIIAAKECRSDNQRRLDEAPELMAFETDCYREQFITAIRAYYEASIEEVHKLIAARAALLKEEKTQLPTQRQAQARGDQAQKNHSHVEQAKPTAQTMFASQKGWAVNSANAAIFN